MTLSSPRNALASFFIARPVFAIVLAIATLLAGVMGIYSLSISQYPDIAPVTVRVNATYTGATAEAVENSVTKKIESAMTGLDGLLYMESSSSTGSASIELTFANGTDPELAQVEVQNKLSRVESQLPDAVQDAGVRVNRSPSGILMIGNIISRDGRYTSDELSDIMSSQIEDRIERLDGVGAVQSFGSGFAMRIWLDPAALLKYQLVPSDVTAAITAQNAQGAAGSIGAVPVVKGQQLKASIIAQSQMTSVDEFKRISLKTASDGSVVRLSDVARVEVGLESYGQRSSFNGMPSAGFGVQLASGANAISTANLVHAELDSLKDSLPEGVEIAYSYETTPFVELSIEKVVETLIEAVILVFLVLLLFLQNIRATLIPMIAVPVVLLGTFGVLAALGYSINMLTMFAMVLAIGLLVDDAIVVIENVERIMREEKLSPREATEKSMGEITGALIGIALVLTAVFVPMAFFSGSVGGHLPPVLGDDRQRHAALGSGRHHPDAGSFGADAETQPRGGPPPLAGLVRPRIHPIDGGLFAHGWPAGGQACPDVRRLPRPDRRRLRALQQTADLVPAGGGPGRADDHDHPAGRRQRRPHPSGDRQSAELLSHRGKGCDPEACS